MTRNNSQERKNFPALPPFRDPDRPQRIPTRGNTGPPKFGGCPKTATADCADKCAKPLLANLCDSIKGSAFSAISTTDNHTLSSSIIIICLTTQNRQTERHVYTAKMRFTVLAAIVCALAYTEALPIGEEHVQKHAVMPCSKEEPQSMFSGIVETFSSLIGFETEAEPEKKNPWKKIGKHEGKKWKHYGKHQKKKWGKKPREDPPSDSEFEDSDDEDDEIIEIKIKNPKKHWKDYGRDQKKYWKHRGKEERRKWAPKKPEDDDDEQFVIMEEGGEGEDAPDKPVKDPKKYWKHYGKDQKKYWKHFGKDQKKKWSPKEPASGDEGENEDQLQKQDAPPEAPDCSVAADPKACWDDYGKEQKKYWKHYGKEQKKHWKKYGKHQKEKWGKKPDDGEGDGEAEKTQE